MWEQKNVNTTGGDRAEGKTLQVEERHPSLRIEEKKNGD